MSSREYSSLLDTLNRAATLLNIIKEGEKPREIKEHFSASSGSSNSPFSTEETQDTDVKRSEPPSSSSSTSSFSASSASSTNPSLSSPAGVKGTTFYHVDSAEELGTTATLLVPKAQPAGPSPTPFQDG